MPKTITDRKVVNVTNMKEGDASFAHNRILYIKFVDVGVVWLWQITFAMIERSLSAATEVIYSNVVIRVVTSRHIRRFLLQSATKVEVFFI